MPTTVTRKEFLETLAAATILPTIGGAAFSEALAGKLLIVVAHPDDEYACAATTYRLVRELGWVADQIVITNGEGGYRYSTLAETVYGKPLAGRPEGLTTIRREETLRAGKILGIRRHKFLDQKDPGFATDRTQADVSLWDRAKVVESLRDNMAKGEYDAVFVLIPTADTHAHHREAALLAQTAWQQLPEEARPLLLGVDARSSHGDPLQFGGAGPVLNFDRTASFGYQDALDYQIVVNWLIAEYKSQGLFQKDCLKHDVEQYWQLAAGPRGARTLAQLRAGLQVSAKPAEGR